MPPEEPLRSPGTERSRQAEVGPEEVLREIGRLRAWPAFQRAPNLLQLLEFLVATELEGNGHLLKETYIGATFFQRPYTYDPRADAVVRVSANRLRLKLDQYYAENRSSLRIRVPRGGYAPRFERSAEGQPPEPQPTARQAAPPEIAALARDAPRGGSSSAGITSSWWLRLSVAAAVALVAVLVGLSVHSLRAIGGAHGSLLEKNLISTPLTAESGTDTDPAISPDGRRLAFVSNRDGDGDFQIRLKPLFDSGPGTVLSTGSGRSYHPAWSPDGNRIAFLYLEPRRSQIVVERADGSERQIVSELPFYRYLDDHVHRDIRNVGPVWTADGRSLIFARRMEEAGPEHLLRHDLSTGKEQWLTSGTDDVEDEFPRVSPDGLLLAFVRFRTTSDADLEVLDLRKGSLRTVLSQWGGFDGIAWAPGGQELVVSASRDHVHTDLWRVSLKATKPVSVQTVATGAARTMQPVFAPDGHLMAFTSITEGDNIAAVKTATSAQTASSVQMVLRSAEQTYGASLSPDAARVAFFSNRSGSLEVWTSDRHGESFGPPRQLTHGIGFRGDQLSWSPDGSMLVASVRRKRYTLQVIDVATGNFSPLQLPTLADANVISPVWSEDARWIYFSVTSAEHYGVWRASTLAVPRVERLTATPARAVRVDGETVYMTPLRGVGIFRLSGPGSQPEAVPALADVLPSRQWLINRGLLYFVDGLAKHRLLTQFSCRTGAVTRFWPELERMDFFWGGLTLDPDSHLLLYARMSEGSGAQIRALVERQ